MKFTIRYIPLSKIRPNVSAKMTERVRRLRRLMWDCVHVLAVRKDRRSGGYTLISGIDRYEYLNKQTYRTHAPCIIDEARPITEVRHLLQPLLRKQRREEKLRKRPGRLTLAQWSMIRDFLRQESRFEELSRVDKLKVLLLALRYKKTVVVCMRSLVDELTSK